jgi:hypothetical protein
LVDAVGTPIAPVVGVTGETQRVLVSLAVAGRLANVWAHATFFEGTTAPVAYYTEPNCPVTGSAYIRSEPPGSVFPPTVVININNTQILAVPDNTVAPVNLTIQSEITNGGCQATSGDTVTHLYPIIGTLDLGTIGQSPFRVVRSQP